MRWTRRLQGLVALALAAAMVACGGGTVAPRTPVSSSTQGNIFILGTDAPVGSVVAFRITFTGLTVSDGTTTVPLITEPQEIEFARLNGLRTLLALEPAATGSYNRVTVTMASPVISFLDFSAAPPSVGSLNGTLVRSSVTVDLPNPLVVTENDLVGLFVDFRLRDSIEVDGAGQMTGNVDPHISIRALRHDAPDAEVDEIRGSVSNRNAQQSTFLLTGPRGRSITVVTDTLTEWSEGDSFATLTDDTVVLVSGRIERATLRLRASEVQVLSRGRFLVGGLITDVRPPDGRADAFDLFIRTEVPDLPEVEVGGIGTFTLDDNEWFGIRHLRLPLQHFLFNRSAMVPGQRVSVGGTLTAGAVDVRRVMLHIQGLDGMWIPGSTHTGPASTGWFGFSAAGITGRLFDGPVRVYVSERTRWVNLSGLSDLAGTTALRLRVVGLVLKDPASGEQLVIARMVEALN